MPKGIAGTAKALWQGLAFSLLPQPAWTWILIMRVEEGRLRTQRFLLHGGCLGVSYLPGWSHIPCLRSKLEDVLGPESLPGYLQIGLSGYPGHAICSLIQPTAYRVVNCHHIAAAPGSFSRAVRGSAKQLAFPTLPWPQSQVH